MRLTLLSLVFVTTLPTSALGQTIWTVDDDGGPGVDFADVQPAIDACGPLDVILVEPGEYGAIRIGGKAVTLFGPTVGARINGTSDIENVGPEQRVLLQGVAFRSSAATALTVAQCAGTVWLEDVSVRSVGSGFIAPSVGMKVSGCEAVVLAEVEVEAVVVGGTVTNGSNAGLEVIGSTLHAYGGSFAAGKQELAADGDAGLAAFGSTVFVAGARVTGGSGAQGDSFGGAGCADGADGGPAVLSSTSFGGTASSVTLLDCALVGGGGGAPSGRPCASGGTGPPTEVFGGSSVTDLAPAARTMTLDASIVSTPTVAVELAGAPGDVVLLGVALETAPTFVVALQGSLCLGPAPAVLALGAVDAAGALTVTFPVGAPPGPAVLFLQALFASAAEGLVLGTPRSAVLGAG